MLGVALLNVNAQYFVKGREDLLLLWPFIVMGRPLYFAAALTIFFLLLFS